jgi:hypothetical protein
MLSARIRYLLDSALRTMTAAKCRYCRSNVNDVIDRKFFVTTLRKCRHCGLQYRHPLDRSDFNERFYQEDYVQEGLTTDLPSATELGVLLRNRFSGSSKDFSSHIRLVQRLTGGKTSLKIVDYGASWGYASYQFREAGFCVQSLEISRRRAKFGAERLQLDIRTAEEDLKPGNDVFFTSHVIEHHPDVARMIALSRRLLSESGLFIAYSPNGSKELRDSNHSLFTQFWGQVHPNLLSADFYKFAFADNPYLITSSPYSDRVFARWDGQSQVTDSLAGEELLIISAPNKRLGH